jgi:LysR family glycine cleavage system transcriptional activator
MNDLTLGPRLRPLAVGNLRAFEAVARRLSFREAAEELFLTQSAISRQIKALEEEVGTALFLRGTRHVELTADGALLLRALVPALERLDAGVRQIRSARGRRVVNVTTFASFTSMWLIPRLEAYQRLRPDVDIRVSASDTVVDLDDGELDLALRYLLPGPPPAKGVRLFGEMVTPTASPWLVGAAARGDGPPLTRFADLSQHTLTEEDSHWLPGAENWTWRHWAGELGLPPLQPRRWMYLNYGYQQIQAAMSGQAVALARLSFVAESLARGELVEPFGASGRVVVPGAYWLVQPSKREPNQDVRDFIDWVMGQVALTREAVAALTRGQAPAGD